MSFDPVEILTNRLSAAIRDAFPDIADPDPQVRPTANPQFGDFQCNAAMALGKRVGRPPREVASLLVERADLSGIAHPLTPADVAGPGFINIRLLPDALSSLLDRFDTPDLGVEKPAQPATVVVDLCGVNLAKQMHVGHLRATVIGDALARTFEALGLRVLRQNHLGDWGLPIAMVVARLRRDLDAGRVTLDGLTLDALNVMYKSAQRECSADSAGLEAARRWWHHPKATAELEAQVSGAVEALAEAKRTLIALQAGDAKVVALWQKISAVTIDACLSTCARLHATVRPEHTSGESSYRDRLGPLVEDLLSRHVAEVSEGAVVVRLEEFGIAEPALVRKSDGGFLYATTDIAAIRHRVQTLGASRVVYAVDARQSLHFRQVFAASHKAGYTVHPVTGERASLEHAAFGMMLGEDGRPFKTRSGESEKLSDLIDEAVQRARVIVQEKNPSLDGEERDRVAEAVGVAAIKYADLSSDRSKDYVFSYERMVAFEGNTGPYLLYAVARINSIFRNAAERLGAAEASGPALQSARIDCATPEERTLALLLLRYPGTLRGVADSLEPHRLCQYLRDVAVAYSAFFERCPVLAAPDESTRRSRLRLCDLTRRVLARGLECLGIGTLDRM